MKIKILILTTLFGCRMFCAAQNNSENTDTQSKFVLYSVFANFLPDGFNVPGIGFVNIAKGNHATAYIGFINYADSLTGAQLGFVNTTKKLNHTAQVGFVNTNLTGRNSRFVQTGFVNSNFSVNNKGVQTGFVNTNLGGLQGAQTGFVNTNTGSLTGAQTGFVNTGLGDFQGTQIGFLNINTGKLKGLQLGFVNYADTIAGVPVGFISIVRKGGYRALEVGVSELAPVNLSFKLGVKKLYSSFNVAYNPPATGKTMFGLGLGSIIPLKKSFFFNPELIMMNAFCIEKKYSQQSLSLTPAFAYQYKSLNIVAGISVNYLYTDKDNSLNEPFFQILNYEFNSYNKIILGARAGIRFVL